MLAIGPPGCLHCSLSTDHYPLSHDAHAATSPIVRVMCPSGAASATNNTPGRAVPAAMRSARACLSVSSADYAWLRLSGEAVFSDSMAAKELCLQNPIVRSQYGDASNPIFTVFWLRDARAVIADFSGEPPRTYTL